MALPEGFSEWEHLQNTIRRVHNESVMEFFHGQPDNSINTPRASAKHACLMKDDDTANMTIIRLWLYWIICRKLRDVTEPYYGIPIETFNQMVTYKPQITCYFLEDHQDVEPGFRPVEGQLSIRLVGETTSSISQADLTNFANKVNTAFGQNNGYVWKKGKDLFSYVDKINGHQFKVLATNQSKAVEVVQKLLSITSEPYNSELLKLNVAINPSTAYPTNPGNQVILGKTHKKPRKRPVADVRFVYASLKIHGLPKPIVLVDKSGYWSEAIIKAY
ncbi:MAG: hypothetical protein AB4372_06970 [Xenococcus sp. (in: cyanobacteria)]